MPLTLEWVMRTLRSSSGTQTCFLEEEKLVKWSQDIRDEFVVYPSTSMRTKGTNFRVAVFGSLPAA